MSERISTTAVLPRGQVATPVTLLTALRDSIGQLETDAIVAGVKPVWDTLEISTEEEIDHIRNFVLGPEEIRHTLVTLSVLAIDPKEITE